MEVVGFQFHEGRAHSGNLPKMQSRDTRPNNLRGQCQRPSLSDFRLRLLPSNMGARAEISPGIVQLHCAKKSQLAFLGTFLPFFRALDRPIAIACWRFFTLPPLPLFAVPRL